MLDFTSGQMCATLGHNHPAIVAAIRKAGDAYNRTRLTPTVARLFDTILRWRR